MGLRSEKIEANLDLIWSEMEEGDSQVLVSAKLVWWRWRNLLIQPRPQSFCQSNGTHARARNHPALFGKRLV